LTFGYVHEFTSVLEFVAAKVDGVWQKKTFKEYYNDVIAAAKSLIEVCNEVNRK